MNLLRTILLLFSILFFAVGCTKNSNIIETKEKIGTNVNLKKSEFTIKGMTCEIGCAKLIQSKLAKTSGIKFVEVSFKDSIAMVEYDTNKLSINKITAIVNNIAGGDLYKVTTNKDVTEFSIQKK